MPKRLAYAGLAFGALILIGLLASFFGEEETELGSEAPGQRSEIPAPSRALAQAPGTRAKASPGLAGAKSTASATPVTSASAAPQTSGTPPKGKGKRRDKRPRVTLEGLVVTPGGQPVAGARVQARSVGRRGSGSEATTDALGRFRLELRAREAWVRARPPAGAPGLAGSEGVTWKGAGQEARYELAEPLRLSQGVALVGEIRSLAGEPIPGARLRAWGRRNQARATADAQGRFRLEGLSEASYSVEASAKGFVSDTVDVPVTLQRGGEASFTLSPAGSLSGVIRGADGQPLGRAAVFAFRAGEQLLQATASREGTYRLEGLGPGPLEVFVRSRDRALTGRVAANIETGVDASLDLTLDEGAKVQGALSDAKGNPLSKWQVRVSNASGQVRRRGESDAEGNYEVKGLYPGTYTITARPPESRGNLVEEEIEVTSGTLRHDLRAILGGRLSGRVLDPEGKPVRAEVHAFQGEDTKGFARCDEEGRYVLSDLPPGSYVLFLRRRSRQEGELVGRHELEVQAGDQREGLELSVYRPATIRGRVVGLEAGRLGKLRIQANSVVGSVQRRTRTEEDGTFSLAPFYDGEYELKLSSSRLALLARDLGVAGLAADPVRVRIEGGADQEVVLRVRPVAVQAQ